MSWDSAANWLMAHNAPASFHGPAPYTPDGPEHEPYSDVDPDYEEHLRDWIARVERGDIEPMEDTPWTS